MAYALLAVKTLLVVALFGVGVWMVLASTQVIPLVSYRDLEAHGLPVGLAFIAAGVAVLALWKIGIETEKPAPGQRGGYIRNKTYYR
jgi:hypothetical protein